MRILVLSCIHSNLTAFEAVLKDAKDQWDTVWCLGNVICYGIEPNECVELLKTLPHMCMKGLYEEAVLGRCNMSIFNPVDRSSIEWTRKALKPEHIPYLESLPMVVKMSDYTLAQASPRDPLYDYVADPLTAALSFLHFETLYFLCGRLPRPAIYEEMTEAEFYERDIYATYSPRYSEPQPLNGRRKIIVLGGVGVSGTQTPQYAEYGLLDTDKATFEFRRCEYDVAGVLNRLRNANVHRLLIGRWEGGYF